MRKRLITMILQKRVKSSFLGIVLLVLSSCSYTFSTLQTMAAFLQQQSQKYAQRLGLTYKPIGTLNLFHDLEDDLEYILQVDSLKEFTDSLVVYVNGKRLISDEITSIALYNTQCNFTFEFPFAAFLRLLQQEEMRTLVTTYREQIEEYIKNSTHSYMKSFYTKYHGTALCKALIKVIKVRVHFSYTVTNEQLEKDCVSLLALMLRKRVELRELYEQNKNKGILFTTSYSPLRTINIHVVP